MIDLLPTASLHALVVQYGVWLVFVVVLLESAGLPVPGETALVSTAVYAGATGAIGIEWVILVAAAAAITGDNLGYLAGRLLGRRLVRRYGGYIGLTESRLMVGEYLFLRHGGKIVFFGRFIALLRAFAALLAGVNHMEWRRFVVMNGLGGLAWAGLFGGGGYLFGDQVRRVAGPLGMALLAAAVVGIVAAVLIMRRHERTFEERARSALREQR
jgi:membrane protein DedA with SNARE-associated domain